jgi:ribonuclease P protein component
MHLSRLQGRKANDYVLRRGRVWKGKTFNVNWLPGPPKLHPDRAGLYVGTFASTRLDKSAVARNRMRRRVREALRIIAKETSDIPTAQLLVSPRSGSMNAPFEDIVREMRMFLSQLPPWPTKSAHPDSGTSS